MNHGTEQIVRRERRERVSQVAWCGEGCFDSRRRVNSTVGPLIMVSKTLSDEEIQFADAYLNLANPEAHHWAWNILWDAETPEEKLNLVMLVIQRAQLPKDEEALGLLGAGAMEDLMSDWLLDRLKDYLPFSRNLRHCLFNVRMEFEPDTLQQRLIRMRGIH